MSNLETRLSKFRAAWAAKPERSYWPPHLEPAPEPAPPEPAPRAFAGFFVNADDTLRFAAPARAWPEPAAVVAPRPLPGFRDYAEEDRSQAA